MSSVRFCKPGCLVWKIFTYRGTDKAIKGPVTCPAQCKSTSRRDCAVQVFLGAHIPQCHPDTAALSRAHSNQRESGWAQAIGSAPLITGYQTWSYLCVLPLRRENSWAQEKGCSSPVGSICKGTDSVSQACSWSRVELLPLQMSLGAPVWHKLL